MIREAGRYQVDDLCPIRQPRMAPPRIDDNHIRMLVEYPANNTRLILNTPVVKPKRINVTTRNQKTMRTLLVMLTSPRNSFKATNEVSSYALLR